MTTETKPPSFEQSLQKLEEIVRQLEAGDLTLEQSLLAYEKGVRLTAACEKTLSEAEQKVRQLIEVSGEITSEELPEADTTL